MEVSEKLLILADSAKYDVSCASSGVGRRGRKGAVGSAGRAGICHSWSADGRCISLLKVLYSNVCLYDCRYCANRSSRGGYRVSFTPRELAELTISFYRRNYIEGLFLSSGVFASPDRVMEELTRTVRLLRHEYCFNGYIHMKAIPGPSPELIDRAGGWVDRMSVNIELPSEECLRHWAPDKKKDAILTPMKRMKLGIDDYRDAAGSSSGKGRVLGKERAFQPSGTPQPKPFIPAGQSTQLIIGASPEGDKRILKLSSDLYQRYGMRRVYYSAFISHGQPEEAPSREKSLSPLGTIGFAKAPHLEEHPFPAGDLKVREHRLYQADWLMRFYGFSCDEILSEGQEELDLSIDPKSAWAICNRARFPVDVQRADYEELLRVPGIGVRSARRILATRREGPLSFDQLSRLGVVLKRARYFITCGGFYLESCDFSAEGLYRLLLSDGGAGRPDARYGQLYLFDAVTGEL